MGFVIEGKENMVYKLNKALYGLRQAPRAWNEWLDKTLEEMGFQRHPQEYVLYKLQKSNNTLIIGDYVDELIMTCTSKELVAEFKRWMLKIFDISDLETLSCYLGIEVQQDKDGITISQTGYAKNILQIAGMADCNPSEYQWNQGSL